MLSLGPFLQNLIQQPTWGKSWKLPNLAAFPSGQSQKEYWDRVLVSTKYTVFHLLPIPIPSEKWDDKVPKDTVRSGMNPTSSSPLPSFNPQPIWPQTRKISLIWPQNSDQTTQRKKNKGKGTQKRIKRRRKKKRKDIFQLTGSLSNTLGEATMRGFLKFRTICRRSKWKYCAGVVGCTTDMLTWSPSTPSSELSHICIGEHSSTLSKASSETNMEERIQAHEAHWSIQEQISKYPNSDTDCKRGTTSEKKWV